MTRSLDASTFGELEQATISVEEGTSANTSFRQTVVNGTLGTTAITWAGFGTASSPASDTTAGVIEIATQAEVNAGTATNLAVTPSTLANSNFASRKFSANIGDGSQTSYVVTHNLNTFDVDIEVFRNSGTRDTVLAEVQRTSVNSVTVLFDTAPTANAYRVLIKD
jgi:hypothetical protein